MGSTLPRSRSRARCVVMTGGRQFIRAQDLHGTARSVGGLTMLGLLRNLRTYFVCRLVRHDVAAADKAQARGDVQQAARRLARADLRLKKACGLTGWSVDPGA